MALLLVYLSFQSWFNGRCWWPGTRRPRTPSCSCCVMRWRCCGGRLPAHEWTGRLGQCWPRSGARCRGGAGRRCRATRHACTPWALATTTFLDYDDGRPAVRLLSRSFWTTHSRQAKQNRPDNDAIPPHGPTFSWWLALSTQSSAMLADAATTVVGLVLINLKPGARGGGQRRAEVGA